MALSPPTQFETSKPLVNIPLRACEPKKKIWTVISRQGTPGNRCASHCGKEGQQRRSPAAFPQGQVARRFFAL